MSESRPRILIVDDREQNRYVLCRILRMSEYNCVEARTGAEALELAQSLPDLIILDVNLPDMSGYEVCRQIRRDARTAHISILQISASFVSAEQKARALEGGADGYLVHPIDGTVLVATVRSLLRLRAAEAVARQSAEQWQSSFDALTEGIACIDAGGRLIRWNAAFADMCGGHCDLRSGEDADVLLQSIFQTSEPLRHEGPEHYRGQFQIGRRSIEFSVNHVGTESVQTGSVLVLTDITDRQLAEYALRTAEKISATGKLAHAIAHEINNPLESLTNLIYLAQGSNSLDTIYEYLSLAATELARIARITKQTLSFHRDTRRPVSLDIGDLVREVVALFEKNATMRRIRIVCDCHAAPAIYGFPGQLSQVFGNLVRNAAEAAPPDSDVTIRVRPIQRDGREGTRVTVHDRGRGIPLHVQEKMFDPFFTTKELRGSGLGLWVSKNLILNHQGTIRFRSSSRLQRSGTTFEVYLPVGGVNPSNLQSEEAA